VLLRARPRAALCASLLLTVTSLVASSAQTTGARPADAPPPGYLPPPLNPTRVVLETRLLSEGGVYALLSNTPFADNAGFVVGADAVLVVDSGFNGRIGQQIIDAVKRVTGKPIRYLVNTNAFGDHIFGNYVFPRETRIIASRRSFDALRGTTIPEMAARMAPTVGGDLSVFAGVELRLADETFDEHWSVDLGGRRVEAHFFGAGTAIKVIMSDAHERADLIAGPGPTTANPSILRGKTVGQFLSWLHAKTGEWAR